jgi:predicted transcriptional regulator of viral defense system
MESPTLSHNNLSNGEKLENYIAANLAHLFPNYKVIDRNERVANSTFDIHAKAPNGTDYFIEVKASKCNRLSVGQIVEYKASLSKVNPNAKIILICKGINPSLKETLKKIDIDVETFADLGISLNIPDYKFQKIGNIKLSPVEQNAYFALIKKGIVIATAEDLKSTLNVSYAWAKNILSKLESHGAAQRVGKGKYVIIPADVLYRRKSYVADPLILISELMKGLDYYVAYLSAAHVHGVTEQMPFKTTVAVLKQLRPIRVGNVHISFVKLKESRFFGYNEIRYADGFLNVSDMEKTMVDCVDRQEICGGIAEVIRIISNAAEAKPIDWQKLVQYVRKYENQALAQRIGFIIELLTERKKIQVDQRLLDDLSSLTSSKIYPLDVKAPREGKISKKWGIINNAGLLEI